MPSRNILHKFKLLDFALWLLGDGWEIDPANGECQVLRARKGKRFLALYEKHGAKEHYTVRGVDMPVVRAYLKNRSSAERRWADGTIPVSEVICAIAAVEMYYRGLSPREQIKNLCDDLERLLDIQDCHNYTGGGAGNLYYDKLMDLKSGKGVVADEHTNSANATTPR